MMKLECGEVRVTTDVSSLQLYVTERDKPHFQKKNPSTGLELQWIRRISKHTQDEDKSIWCFHYRLREGFRLTELLDTVRSMSWVDELYWQ